MRFKLFNKLLILLAPVVLFAYDNSRALYIKKYSNESKIALVIGNSNYTSTTLSKLKNPINDATDMKNILQSKGFKVHFLLD